MLIPGAKIKQAWMSRLDKKERKKEVSLSTNWQSISKSDWMWCSVRAAAIVTREALSESEGNFFKLLLIKK